LLAQEKDLVSVPQGQISGLRENESSSLGFEQGFTDRLLQLRELGTHCLHGQAKTLGGTGNTALFSDDPEVMQMAKIEAHCEDLSSFSNSPSNYLWFFRGAQKPALKCTLVNFFNSL
jgi:hypothetical protein